MLESSWGTPSAPRRQKARTVGAKKKSDGRDWQTTQEEAVRLALCILLAPDGGDLLATEFL
jgi:hypothetical protein